MNNELINLSKMKRRSMKGTRSKKSYNVTLSKELMEAVRTVMPTGRGQYGSSFLELSAWVMLASITSGEDIDSVGRDLKAIIVSPYFATNIARLARMLNS